MTFPLWRRKWRTTPRNLPELYLCWHRRGAVRRHAALFADAKRPDEHRLDVCGHYVGRVEYPYHPDGGKCVMYSAADIITLYSEYKSFVTKQTTYCNALRQWAKRETDQMLSAPSITDAPFPRTSKRKSRASSAQRRRRLWPSSTSSPPKEDRNGKELCM